MMPHLSAHGWRIIIDLTTPMIAMRTPFVKPVRSLKFTIDELD